MQELRQRVDTDVLVIFIAGVIVFTVGLPSEFIGFQARFGLMARQMWEHGPSFFARSLQGPYPDYSGAWSLVICLAGLGLGGITTFTATLPTAAVSAVVLVVTYRIGALRCRQWGWYAAVMTAMSHLFISEARGVSLDQYTTLATVVCFYLVYAAAIRGERRYLWFVPVMLVLGFVFRGPIGLVVPGAVVGGFYLWERDWRRFAIMGVAALVLLAACSAGLLAAAYQQGGESFAGEVMRMQATGRIGCRGTGCAYYWVAALTQCAPSYPLAILVVATQGRRIWRREGGDYRLMGLLVVWVLIVLGGMSLTGTRKMRYVLPMVPALSLVASYVLVNRGGDRLLARIKEAVLRLCAWVPEGGAIVVAVVFILRDRVGPVGRGHYYAAWALLFVAAAAGWLVRRWGGRKSRVVEGVLVGGALLAGVVVEITVFEPMNYRRERTRPFAAQVEELLSRQGGEIVFYNIWPDTEDVKLMVNIQVPVRVRYIKSAQAIAGWRQKAFFIGEENDYERLPPGARERLEVVLRGRIGHKRCVVFRCQDRQDGPAGKEQGLSNGRGTEATVGERNYGGRLISPS